MFKINGVLAITNGQPFVGDIDFCQYANGTKYHLHNGMLVIETPVIFSDTSPEGILKTIEEGKLDFWPINTFRGWNNAGLLRERILKMIDEDHRRKERQKLISELESRFPSLPKELMEKVYNLDHYHEYSDDGAVYRNAQARHEQVLKELRELGMDDFYREYRKILYNFDYYFFMGSRHQR